jgi:2-polyprenyl-3-methyl-5-hydroxy-6-metoxy-1,4-benzoquinol methylase
MKYPKIKKNPLGFYEIAKKPTTVELEEYYAKKYYQNALGSYEHAYSDDEYRYFENKLKQHHIAALNALDVGVDFSGNFLDVGCGEGFSLNYFKRHGFKTKGLDFSSAGVEKENPGCLDCLTTGDLFELLEQEVKSNIRYDIIWVQNVLEHVLDPVGLMKTLHRLVSKKGIAVITVPNDFSIVQNEALDIGHIKTQFWVSPPDHLTYFNYNSLKNIAKNTGWKVCDLLGDFPVDWYLYHPDSNYVDNPSVGKKAHLARVQLENLFSRSTPTLEIIELWRAMAKVGSGRDLTIFISPDE